MNTEKNGTVPEINVVLAPWTFTYDEYYEPGNM